MALAQRQTHRSMEQPRKHRNESTTVWSTHLQQSRKESPMEKRQCLQKMILGKLDSNIQKNEMGHFLTPYRKNKFKMNERPICETGNHHNPRGKSRQQPL